MFGAILKATNSSFQKGMTFCCSIYVKKVMKLLAFLFEHHSYAFIKLQIRVVSRLIILIYPIKHVLGTYWQHLDEHKPIGTYSILAAS